MTAEPQFLLDRLRQLNKEATPGPWRHNSRGGVFSVNQNGGLVTDGMRDASDADIIVALRNMVPEIIEAFELVEALSWQTWMRVSWRNQIAALLSKVSQP